MIKKDQRLIEMQGKKGQKNTKRRRKDQPKIIVGWAH